MPVVDNGSTTTSFGMYSYVAWSVSAMTFCACEFRAAFCRCIARALEVVPIPALITLSIASTSDTHQDGSCCFHCSCSASTFPLASVSTVTIPVNAAAFASAATLMLSIDAISASNCSRYAAAAWFVDGGQIRVIVSRA
jgi:hypothetical protein